MRGVYVKGKFKYTEKAGVVPVNPEMFTSI